MASNSAPNRWSVFSIGAFLIWGTPLLIGPVWEKTNQSARNRLHGRKLSKRFPSPHDVLFMIASSGHFSRDSHRRFRGDIEWRSSIFPNSSGAFVTEQAPRKGMKQTYATLEDIDTHLNSLICDSEKEWKQNESSV
jgi:hypothetical protein